METARNKQIHIVGGGTIEPIRSHLALSAPAYGSTARQLGALCTEIMPEMDIDRNFDLSKKTGGYVADAA
ncbi:MAG: hypothetical protein JWL89_346 [Candidatus Saccharibacteria bacterium]|nr:hypothetical protein [Candidatus Saccharibacteria bacterium]